MIVKCGTAFATVYNGLFSDNIDVKLKEIDFMECLAGEYIG